jgi:outer membrane receptor protein involved in Fe transport
MKTLPSVRRSAYFAFGLLATAVLAPAQTAPVSPSAPTTDDDVLQLDEFTVLSGKTDGYRATNAITATGIGSRIADTPLAISVVTGELMADASMFDAREALNLVPGVLTNPVNESRAVVRGFSGLVAYRNGQYRRQLMTTWNMDRIEVIKGPAAIFFGAVRPGGIVNNVTTKPVFTGSFTDVKATVGNGDYYRGEFFTNQVLNKKLAIRVGGGLIDAGGLRDFEYKRENYVGASAVWKPTVNQQFTLDLEAIHRDMFYLSSYPVRSLINSKVHGTDGAIAAQAGINRLTTTADTANRAYLTTLGYSGTATAANFYPLYDSFAPYSYTTSLSTDARQLQRTETIDLDYLLKINDSLVWQTTLNYAYDNTSGLQPSDGDTRPYADGSLRFRTENFINVRKSYNLHNKLTWRFDLGPTKHTIQFGQEYQRVIFDRPGFFNPLNNTYNNSPGNSTVSGVPNKYVINFFPGSTPPVSLNTVFADSGQTFSIVRRNYDNATGLFLVDQARFFKDRLFLLLGARYNKFTGHSDYDRPVSNSNLSVFTPGGLTTRGKNEGKGGTTPQLGGLFKLFGGISAYTTYSSAVEVNTSVDADGVAAEPVESQSFDVGLKTENLNGRLTTTFGYYDIARQNLAYNDTEKQIATGRSPYFIFGNSEASRGIEFESNWSPTDNYQLILGWSHIIDAKNTKSNVATNVGRRFGYTPDNTYMMWNRYTFTKGPVKGATLAFGIRHNDEAGVSADINNQARVPAFTVYDAMVGYNFKFAKRTIRAQFNVKNLTNLKYREGDEGFFAPLRTYYFSVSTRF